MKFRQLQTMSPTSILFSLDARTIKVGVNNRRTQYKPDPLTDASQTDPLSFEEKSTQMPDAESGSSEKGVSGGKKRFTSLIHFLKAASLTISALVDDSQFSGPSETEKAPLARLNKFTTETVPFQICIISTRSYALVSEPASFGRIIIWTAGSQLISYHLISAALPSCLPLHRDGKFVIAGTESGTLLLWDIFCTESTKQEGIALILHPVYATDSQRRSNHRQQIVAVSVFGKSGAKVVCSLDVSAIARFWYIRNETTEPSLIKAETVQLSSGFLPTFSLAIRPHSLNEFLVGAEGKIFNCWRFAGPTSAPVFTARAAVKSIAFSPHLPSIFVAASDDGRLGFYDVSDPEP
jgi:WD40 repeat protein